MMKTPDEIKKGLERCKDCQSCTEYSEPKCPYNDVYECVDALLDDAFAYIQQLEAERDAAVEALKDFGGCMACNSASVSKKDSPCRECILDGQVTHDYWIWRGVQKEE